MFCPKCGVKNDDSASFCVNCGNQLSKTGEPSQLLSGTTAARQKSAVLAVILNFVLPGIGYLYWGFRKVLTVHPLLLWIGVVVAESLTSIYVSYAGILSFVINAFFAYDLYVKTTGQRGWVEAT